MKKTVIVLALILLCGVFFSCAKHEHQFGEWKTVKEPKCAETGSEERVCECGEKQSRSIPAKGHKEEVVAAVEATCTETGLTEGTRCTVCGEMVKAQEEVPAKGHVEKLVTDTEPTCTEKGAGHNECEVCGERFEDVEIPAKGHTESTVIDKEATCTKNGTGHIECTFCGETLRKIEIPAKGHVESGWKTDKEPTCAKEGSKHTECTVCGTKIKTEKIAKKAHTWKEATCDKPKTCTVCGATEGKALGHLMTGYKCSRCGIGVGQVKGTITWQYNKFIGTKPDVGAIVFLLPLNENTKKYNNINAVSLWTGSHPSGIHVAKCDGYGNYDFGDEIIEGEYYMFIISNNTNNSQKFVGPTALLRKYLSETDLNELYKRIGYNKCKTEFITVQAAKCLTISYDFGYTYF